MKGNLLHRVTALLMIVTFVSVGMIQFHHHHCNGETHVAILGPDLKIHECSVDLCHHECDHGVSEKHHSSNHTTDNCDENVCALHIHSSVTERLTMIPVADNQPINLPLDLISIASDDHQATFCHYCGERTSHCRDCDRINRKPCDIIPIDLRGSPMC